MADPALIDELSDPSVRLPEQAIAHAVREPGLISEDVLRLLAAAAEGAPLTEREASLLFWGVHILAAVRDRRAYLPFMRLLRRPSDEVDRLLGDAVTATMPKIVAGLFDGDADVLFALLAEHDWDEFLRQALFGALAFLTAEGRIDRAATVQFLKRFDEERLAPPEDVTWSGWEDTIALLGLRELVPRVEAAWSDGRTVEDLIESDWFFDTLARAEAEPNDRSRFARQHLGYIENVAAELNWVGDPAEAGLDDAEAELEDLEALDAWPEEPARNPFRDVGRNDPCPCGSGKKFKKCCLGK